MSEILSEDTAAERFDCFIEDLHRAGKNVELVQASKSNNLDDLAQKLGCETGQLHKTVCLNYKDERGKRYLVAVVVPATGRVDTDKVAKALGVTTKIKAAQADFITEQTGFIPGGIPPIGFDAIRLVDERTFTHQIIFAGGGNNLNSYTKMDPNLLKELDSNIISGDYLQS